MEILLRSVATLRLRKKYANKEFQVALETTQAGKIYKYERKSALVKTHAVPLTFLINVYF